MYLRARFAATFVCMYCLLLLVLMILLPSPPPPMCRLWQLQSKMAAVGGEGTYEARLERVVLARAGIEQRLQVGLAAGTAQYVLPASTAFQLVALPGLAALLAACTALYQYGQINLPPCLPALSLPPSAETD
jgi:hypothetical protein